MPQIFTLSSLGAASNDHGDPQVKGRSDSSIPMLRVIANTKEYLHPHKKTGERRNKIPILRNKRNYWVNQKIIDPPPLKLYGIKWSNIFDPPNNGKKTQSSKLMC